MKLQIFRHFRVIENVHIGVLAARRLMYRLGLSLTNLLSSPYHMRRIHVIAASVFAESDADLRMVPTRYEHLQQLLWWLNSAERCKIVSEVIKIAWFLMNRPFFNPPAYRTAS